MPKLPRRRIFSQCGDSFRVQREAILNHGLLELVETGSYNIDDFINSFDADISVLINRLVHGDTSVVRGDGYFDEHADFPKTIFDAHDSFVKMNELFSQCDKSKFPTFESFVEGLTTAILSPPAAPEVPVSSGESKLDEGGDSNA